MLCRGGYTWISINPIISFCFLLKHMAGARGVSETSLVDSGDFTFVIIFLLGSVAALSRRGCRYLGLMIGEVVLARLRPLSFGSHVIWQECEPMACSGNWDDVACLVHELGCHELCNLDPLGYSQFHGLSPVLEVTSSAKHGFVAEVRQEVKLLIKVATNGHLFEEKSC